MEEKLLCGIYKITSPVGKVYIGQSKDFEKRFSDYRRGRCPQQRKLFNSLYKYGFINHTIDIIEICDIEDLDCRERYWQDFYNVKDRDLGLNCVLVACDDKKEEKLIVPRVEKLKEPNQAKKKMKELEIEFNRFKLSVNKSKSLSGEEKQHLIDNFKEGDLQKRKILSKKTKLCKNTKRYIPVLDTQSGVFYNNLKEVCSLYNLNYGTMKQRLRGKLQNNTPFIFT